jgi:hypothetical protein
MLAPIASGDQEATEAFLDRHQGAACRFLKAHTASEADCEDALQETFIAAFRGAGSFRGDASAQSRVLGEVTPRDAQGARTSGQRRGPAPPGPSGEGVRVPRNRGGWPPAFRKA